MGCFKYSIQMVSARTARRNRLRRAQFYKERILMYPAHHLDPKYWNYVLDLCDFEQGLGWIEQMCRFDVQPNIVTFNKLLRMATMSEQVLQVFTGLYEHRIEQDTWTMNIFVKHWATDFDTAIALVKKIHCVPNYGTCNTLVDLATRSAEVYRVMDLMDSLGYEYGNHVWHRLLQVAPHYASATRYYNLMQRCGARVSIKTKEIIQSYNR